MATKEPTFIIYRIFYDDQIVYVGRTKQPLTTRIHGHLFQKPMHRTVHIDQVSKIEYATLQTEADMNLYEIYYILKYHPPLNVDDKARDRIARVFELFFLDIPGFSGFLLLSYPVCGP